MFITKDDQIAYIVENYPEVTDSRIDDNHWDLFCSECNIVRGFQVVQTAHTTTDGQYGGVIFDAPRTVYFKCPVCRTYKFWILFRLPVPEIRADGKTYTVPRWYKVTSIPNDGSEDIQELPSEPPALRAAYRQAVRAMDANAHIAAAAMFRRALQVITREILKAPPGNLAIELKSIVGTKYNGINISQDFSDVGYIIKEAGNQGAHPDEDLDLLDFTQEDAEDLQNIFMELVSELFVQPEATKKAKADFLKRRKITS
jgi:hypothetical protein